MKSHEGVRQTPRVAVGLAGGALTLSLAAAAGAGWWFQSVHPRAPAVSLERLVQRCEADMLRGTCRVRSGQTTSSPIDTSVFVAGVGAIDADAYRLLLDAGQALCGVVREHCLNDWDGTACRAARALHGER